MDEAVEGYKNLGALALGLFWLTTVLMVWLLKGENTKTISNHAASAKKVAILFGGASLISSLVWGVFFVKWFTPTFQLGTLFKILIVAMVFLYSVAGIVPDLKGKRHWIHINAALTASVLLIPAMIMIIVNGHVAGIARGFTVLALLSMFFVIQRYVRSNSAQKKLLIYEVVYFLCFDISILVCTYLR